MKALVSSLVLSSLVVAPTVMAADAVSGSQKKEIEKIVHDYLVKNPEVLIEASQTLQQKQQKNMRDQAKSAIQENAAVLFAESKTVSGNPKGDVTIVEFFDYQCIHCKKMAPVLDEIVSNNKNVRVVFMEFPIFGKSSETASRAALAASMQGKYKALHNALLKQDKKLNKDTVLKVAKEIGLDMKQLQKDMQSDKVSKILDDNRKLAEAMRLMGTPAFVVAATPNGQFKKGSSPDFVPGATTKESLQSMIKKASGNS